ncbi:hypothetical protein WL48_33620 [Burkholderia ubonensis]|uniref:hypothetical protein n=1 Tax=Burkholderia ubonensis TaxID=101571 RepID=UPI000753C06B|nr:hypothetical protein [Burkholderia ubonensis]KWC21878.1 hypothetical protein WL48_33620 [Burkholderia ubonensis]KWC47302.1 hypothetical protein WL49_11620 [Burkholderia ubonensis]
MNPLCKTAAWLGCTLLVAHAWAHGVPMPQHGGLVDDAGLVAVEMAPGKGAVDLYLTDDDAPVDAHNVKGVLTVTNPDGKQEASIASVSGNQLRAKGVTVKPGAKVTTLLTMADGTTKVSARFKVK